MLMKLV